MFVPGGRFYQRGGVQVVDLVELQEGGQMVELLVADLEPLAGQRVDDIVGHFGVLRDRQHVVPGAGGRVPYQEHAMPLSLKPVLSLLSRHGSKVPGGAIG